MSGSLAAGAGGVTTVMVMPTDDPFTITPESFTEKIALASGRTHVDFALQAGLGPSREHVRALADLGAISFEIFMSDLPPSLLVDDPAELVASLDAVRDVGRVAGVTPGNNSLYRRAAEIAQRAFGRAWKHSRHHGRRRPRHSELSRPASPRRCRAPAPTCVRSAVP